MTPQDIIARLFNGKPINYLRHLKAQGMAQREKVEWAAVLAAMTPEQRALVDQA